MNVFKRKSIYLAVAAGVGAFGVAGSAAAVTLSQTGTGEVLIYPYYTVRAGTDTYISIANTTASAKAVKVRFLEGKNSREVLDFNLYLSANDMWTGAVLATATGAKLVTTDTSCTPLPVVSATGVSPVVRGADFVNFAYAGTNTEMAAGAPVDPTTGNIGDFEATSLDRTREGYFEIVEMGTIIGGTALETAVTHVSGTPANCTVANALTAAGAAAALTEPTGGLIGSASLMNVVNGTDANYDAIALSAFSNLRIWDVSGSFAPDLTFANPKSSTVFKNGAPVTSAWARVGGSPADPVTAVLMHDQLLNEFVLDVATLSNTDWVVTMPTKRHYVGVDGGTLNPLYAAITPFTSRFYTGGACEAVSLTYYNREEGTPTGSTPLLSPLPPGVQGDALCWESTVLSFNNSGATSTASDILGSTNFVSKAINSSYNNGWMRMSFNGASNNMTDGIYTYTGLPAVGFMVQDFVNGNVGGVLSNYGGAFSHKYRTNITGGAITSPTGE